MSEKIILQRDEAIELWRKGKEDWNQWVKHNQNADIIFRDTDFSKENRILILDHIWPDFHGLDFHGFHFPNGLIDFSNCNFGDGNIIFRKTIFGGSNVDFSHAQFGDGYVDFTYAQFGDGNQKFSDCNFGSGGVSFHLATFGKGYIDFSRSKFDDGEVSFTRTTFGEGGVGFNFVTFPRVGSVDFSHSIFGGGKVDFFSSIFLAESCAGFFAVKFNGSVNFCCVTFKGSVDFTHTFFGKGNIDFSLAEFGRHTSFHLLDLNKDTISFSLQHSVFNGSLEFSTKKEINFIPDFIGTKTTNHTSLSGMICKPKIENKHLFIFSKAIDQNDTEKLCRLKEIAESNKDHAAALRFHADEMRAKRWQKERMSTAASLLDWLFDVFSLYGQSIWRPMAGLLLTIITSLLYTVGFCFPLLSPSSYAQWFTNMGNISYQTWVYGFDIVLSRSIPFLGGARVDGSMALKELKPLLSVNFSLFSTLFSLLAFVFIFLIGLGLRNRFRL